MAKAPAGRRRRQAGKPLGSAGPGGGDGRAAPATPSQRALVVALVLVAASGERRCC